MKRSQLHLVIFLNIALLLGGCRAGLDGSPIHSPTPDMEPPEIETSPGATSTVTTTPSSGPELSPTLPVELTLAPPLVSGKHPDPFISLPEPEPGAQVRKACVPISAADNLPDLAEGSLFLDTGIFSSWPRQSWFERFDLPDLKVTTLGAAVERAAWRESISPDGQWYYSIEESPDHAEYKLHVYSAKGVEQEIVGWDSEMGIVWGWLDSSHLIINAAPNQPELGVYIRYNPFTGDRLVLPPHFPRGLNLDEPYVNYHPSLNQVFYHSGAYWILADLKTDQELWSRKSWDLVGWSPDFEQAVVVSNSQAFSNDLVSDLYLVSTTGQEHQVTQLGIAYPGYRIYLSDIGWSSDSSLLAFTVSLRDSSGSLSLPTLMLVDLRTDVVIDTCLVAPLANIWSPDANLLAVTVAIDAYDYWENRNKAVPIAVETVILNPENHQAYQVRSDAAVIGWMTDSP